MDLRAEQPVGSHGFVRLVDHMGDDAAVCQAARVSYGVGTKSVNEDRGLIRYLMRHWHTTPFEMVVFKFHVKMPIFVARQWIRHRMASINEYSGRYSVMRDEFHFPELRHQSKTNKQGSAEDVDDAVARAWLADLDQHYSGTADLYNAMVQSDVSKEQARIVLPLATYTEFYWKVDLHNLLHFLRLRMDSHAQKEIRDFTPPIADVVRQLCPWSWEAFEDYRLNAVHLSSMEWDMIKRVIDAVGLQDAFVDTSGKMTERELREFREKFA